jgi:hypothetical protein
MKHRGTGPVCRWPPWFAWGLHWRLGYARTADARFGWRLYENAHGNFGKRKSFCLRLLHWEKSGLIGEKSGLAHKSRATWKLVLCARYNRGRGRAFSHSLGGNRAYEVQSSNGCSASRAVVQLMVAASQSGHPRSDGGQRHSDALAEPVPTNLPSDQAARRSRSRLPRQPGCSQICRIARPRYTSAGPRGRWLVPLDGYVACSSNDT